jgi:hypothetical protein
MGSHLLKDPHIEKLIINGRQTECVMSMNASVSNYEDEIFIESIDKQLIEELRSYVVKEKGGDALEPKELPKELRLLIGYKRIEYDFNGVLSNSIMNINSPLKASLHMSMAWNI